MAEHGRRRWGRWVLLCLGAVVLLLAVDGVFAVRSLSSELRGARDSLEEAAELLEAGDVVGARQAFLDARQAAEAADGATGRPSVLVAGALPWIGDDVDAVGTLVEATELASAAGERIADAAQAAGWDGGTIPGVEPGRVDLEVFAAATPALQDADALLQQAENLVAPLDPDGKLGPVADAVRQVKEVLGERARQTSRAADLAELLPGLLGADGERTYAIVMMTLSDPRGSGGYPGSYGVLRATDGVLELEELEPTGDLGDVPPVEAPPDVVRRYERFGGLTHFISSTYSPDWPTSAQIWMRMWEAGGREPLDGVIGADSVWMSYALQAIGPVESPVWPEPITVENVSRILDSETMLTRDKAESDTWQAGIATSLWQAMVTRPLTAEGFTTAMSRATGERHLQVYSTDPVEQALLDELGGSGRMTMPENPLAVSWSGFVGSRTGYFAEKSIDYEAVVGEDGTADVTITLTLTNTAPTEPESILLGSEADNYDVGEYAGGASVYLPAEARDVVVRGGALTEILEREFEHPVVLAVLSAKSGETTTAEISYRVPVPQGVFELGIVPQAELRPSAVSATVTFPEGWDVAVAAPGGLDGSVLRFEQTPTQPVALRAVLSR